MKNEIYERLASDPSQLSTSELIGAMIGGGDKAADISKNILKECSNNLYELSKCGLHQLKQIDGVGTSISSKIIAATELFKRMEMGKVLELKQLDSATAIFDYISPRIQCLEHEEMWLILMNQNYGLIKSVRLSQGGLTDTAVDVRMIMKYCVINNATILAMAHNHPSGNAYPSEADDRLTKRIKSASDIMRIYFADHIIVGSKYYSYRESGRL